jgi:outer membrane protein
MTKTLKLSLVAIFAGISFASAQKIGHINSQDLMLLLPERKQAETAIQEYAKQLEGQLATMNSEYEAKVQEYQSKEAVMTDIIKQDKVKEITDLETRIRNFQTTAQESLQKKEQELLQPMMDKSKKAIQEVAKEAGFKYILDTSLGAVLYHEDGEDIMPLVKKKLGLSDAASPSKEAPKVPVKK